MLHETLLDHRGGLAVVVLQPRIGPGRHGHASARRHLSIWNGRRCGIRHDRHPDGRNRTGITRSKSRALRRNGHDYHAKHKQRDGVFDRRDFAIRNVRIPRDLRRWRIGDGDRNRDAWHGNVGRHGNVRNIRVVGNVGNIHVVGNLCDVGRVDILRNAGNVRVVKNVRLRLKQHGFVVVVANVDVAHNVERPRSNRSSVGILPDWQSWGQSPIGATDDNDIAHDG